MIEIVSIQPVDWIVNVITWLYDVLLMLPSCPEARASRGGESSSSVGLWLSFRP
jgi:hypothetical protein